MLLIIDSSALCVRAVLSDITMERETGQRSGRSINEVNIYIVDRHVQIRTKGQASMF